ncbi:MAG: glycosyltransferase [Kiritimatiellia bacterium]|jgi:glycosyltransferase involved in cell wall biosynthesis
MPKKRIDQLLAGYADGDAISSMAVTLRNIFREWGHPSDIYADPRSTSPSLRADSRPLTEYRGAPTDICLHHYGIASKAAEVFCTVSAVRIMIYHNITPENYFQGYDDTVQAQLATARAQLPEIARSAAAVWTVSRFNADELTAAGITKAQVLPLPFDPAPLDIPPEPRIMQLFSGQRNCLKNILFVGRIAPNKRVEDLITAFAWYNKTLNPFSRLLLVGSNRSAPRYYTMLRMLAGDLDLPNVCFEGFAAAASLAAYYRVADLYVCPSEHEGYCLPLLEAMYRGVPVLARQAGGMPEAMDGAGIMYDKLSAPELAALMHQAITDEPLRQTVVASQRARMQREARRDIAAEVHKLLEEFNLNGI